MALISPYSFDENVAERKGVCAPVCVLISRIAYSRCVVMKIKFRVTLCL